MRSSPVAIGAVALLLLALPAAAADDYALPDPIMTPGAVDPTVSLSDVCNGTTRDRRRVSAATRDQVFAAYSIKPADRYLYELDHLTPLALGGANTPANLWPQPLDEAEKKDRLEREMQRLACVAYRTLTSADADAAWHGLQQEIATDWVAAYQAHRPE